MHAIILPVIPIFIEVCHLLLRRPSAIADEEEHDAGIRDDGREQWTTTTALQGIHRRTDAIAAIHDEGLSRRVAPAPQSCPARPTLLMQEATFSSRSHPSLCGFVAG